MIYTNAKPEFREFGPYRYREYDNYTELVYEDLDNSIGKESLPAVFANFSQGVSYVGDGGDSDGLMDTPMYLTNQALFGVWY